MNPLTNWQVRAYQPGDADGIAALFEAVYHKPMSRAQSQWKLRTLPTPTENEWVAEADGRIVGHYAVTPLRFMVNEREVMVPHTCDVMTHPAFRRSGIFGALSRRANECWQTTAAPFKIGFPQWEILGSVLAEVGWQRVVRVIWLKCVLQPIGFLARKLGLKIADTRAATTVRVAAARTRHGSVEVAPSAEASGEFDQLWRAVARSHTISVVRDRAWVQWRHFDAPEVAQRVLVARRDGAPCGYVAYRIQYDTQKAWAVMVDCFSAPQDHETVRALVQRVKNELVAQGVESIVALVPHGSPLHGALRRAGFWSTRRGYDFSIVPYTQPSVGMNPRDWFLTGAESDVV